MMNNNCLKKVFVFISLLLCLSFVNASRANASLNTSTFITDINQLILSGSTLIASIENVTLTPLTMANQLLSVESSVQTYLDSVGDLYRMVANSTDNTTLSLTAEMLIPLQTLSSITVTLSQSLSMLSKSMTLLFVTTPVSIISSSLKTMLRLSDDIGVMADRILEMADKILIMADNIGLMADKILATQVIQSNNLKLITDALLETQKNLLLLFGML